MASSLRQVGTLAGATATLILGAGSLLFIPVGAAGPAAPQVPASLQTRFAPYRAALDQYCVGCHNDRLQTAGLSFQTLDPADAGAHAEIWEKVAKKLRT